MSQRKRLALHWKILIGLVLGIIVGVILNYVGDDIWSAVGVDDPESYMDPGAAIEAEVEAELESEAEPDERAEANEDAGFLAAIVRFVVNLNDFVGQFFLRGLMFIAVPIVLFSLIVGASSLSDLRKLSRLGGKTIGLYLVTTAVSITIGLLLANVIGPGRVIPADERERLQTEQAAEAQERIEAAVPPSIWETLLDIVPENPFAALAQGNMLQVVFFALVIGVALTLIPREKARPVIRVFDALTDVVIKLVHALMTIAPYAVFALLVPIIASLGMDLLRALLVYVIVVIGGLAIMMFVVYPAILLTMTRVMSYGRFFRGIAPAQLLAFSTSSSAATLPVTMDCCRNRLGVSEQTTSFVCPLGATINMDGTALYQGVAAVFIAQMYAMDLTIAQQLTIVLTATLASIGTAGVPGVGTIMLVIVLQSVQIPLEGIAVILGVDRLLDMCRTACNITGDSMVASVVASSEGELLSAEELEKLLAAEAAEAEENGSSSPAGSTQDKPASQSPAPPSPEPPASDLNKPDQPKD